MAKFWTNRPRRIARAVSAVVILLGTATVAIATSADGASPSAVGARPQRYLYIGGFASPAIAGAAVTRDGAMRLVHGSPFPSGPLSLGMAITPDGATLYSVSAGLQLSSLALLPGTITGYHIGADGVLTEIGETTVEGPVIGAAITPDGSRLFVTVATGSDGEVLSYSISPSGALTPTGAPPASVPGGAISELVISTDARHLFVSSYLANTMSSFTISADSTLSPVGGPVPAGTLPAIPSVSPDGRYLYVSNEGSGNISAYAIGSDGALTPVPGSPYASGSTPHGAIFTPDSRRVYVANATGNAITGWQIAADGSLSPLPGSPYSSPGVARVVLNADATILYALTGAPRQAGKISTFRIHRDGRLTATDFPSIDTGLFWHDGTNAFLTPDQGPIAALRVEGRSHGLTRTFSAAASTDPDGRIASYHWDFGDGSEQTTTTPHVTHHFAAAAGPRTVTVTVTDDEGCSTELIYNGTTVECRGGPHARASVEIAG